MPQTVAELFAYAEANGYELNDRARFCYIDGIWNKESVDQWLTEIQLPVKELCAVVSLLASPQCRPGKTASRRRLR